jgi:hypothetical protein
MTSALLWRTSVHDDSGLGCTHNAGVGSSNIPIATIFSMAYDAPYLLRSHTVIDDRADSLQTSDNPLPSGHITRSS